MSLAAIDGSRFSRETSPSVRRSIIVEGSWPSDLACSIAARNFWPGGRGGTIGGGRGGMTSSAAPRPSIRPAHAVTITPTAEQRRLFCSGGESGCAPLLRGDRRRLSSGGVVAIGRQHHLDRLEQTRRLARL